MVDSGAFRSCFPLRMARDLGVSDDQLTEDPGGGFGVGARFRLWTATVPIRARIGLFEPEPNGSTRPWGPEFRLTPAFTEHEVSLLGRADFFRGFTITFAEEEDGSAFYVASG